MSDVNVIPAWAVALITIGTPVTAAASYVFGRGSKSGQNDYAIANLIQRMIAVEAVQNSSVVTVSNHTQLLQLMANENEKRDKMMGEVREGVATLLERTRVR